MTCPGEGCPQKTELQNFIGAPPEKSRAHPLNIATLRACMGLLVSWALNSRLGPQNPGTPAAAPLAHAIIRTSSLLVSRPTFEPLSLVSSISNYSIVNNKFLSFGVL